jgi:hypothetical protein
VRSPTRRRYSCPMKLIARASCGLGLRCLTHPRAQILSHTPQHPVSGGNSSGLQDRASCVTLLVPKATHSSNLFELRFRSNKLKPSVTPVGSCTWPPHTCTRCMPAQPFRHRWMLVALCAVQALPARKRPLPLALPNPFPFIFTMFTDVDRPRAQPRHFQVHFPSICAGQVIRIMPYGQVHCTLISGRNLKDQDLFGKMGKDNRATFSSTMPLSSLLHFCRVLLFLQIRIAMCSARPD